jgi:hypothetical protein
MGFLLYGELRDKALPPTKKHYLIQHTGDCLNIQITILQYTQRRGTVEPSNTTHLNSAQFHLPDHFFSHFLSPYSQIILSLDTQPKNLKKYL